MSYDPTIGRFISEDPIAFEGGDANLYRYVGNSPTNLIDPTGLEVFPPPGHNIDGTYKDPTKNPSYPPKAPNGSWPPTQFFGPGSPLIQQTGWGCGGLAAWRAGTPLSPKYGLYNPMDIPNMPGAQQFPTFPQAQSQLSALGGNGVIIAIQNPFPDWKQAPGAGNFATWCGSYWEYANHGDSTPGRKIFHSPTLPNMPITVFIVVPR